MQKKDQLLRAALVVVAAAGVWQASALAAPVAATLIDKEFDSALGKFLTKKFCKRIDATAEQTDKLTSLMAETRDETRPLREQFRRGILDISTLMASDDATDEQIKAKATELRSIHEKISDERLDAMLKARHVLTHDQREQINKRINGLITGDALPNLKRRISESTTLETAF